MISLSPKYFRFKRSVAGEIFFVGLPSSIQFMMSVLSNAVLNYVMASYKLISL